MKNSENFSTMSAEQLLETNGGGFAHDLGRVLRFIGLSGGGPTMVNAVIDWWANKAANEVLNP